MTENQTQSIGRKIVAYAAVLVGVCLVSGAGVSLVFVSNRDRIAENDRKAFNMKLAEVLYDAEDPEPIEKTPLAEDTVYMARMASGVRYVAMGSAQGYQSKVTVLASLDAPSDRAPVQEDPVLYRVAVVSSGETPGLGENIHAVEADVSLWGALAGQRGSGGEKRPQFQAQFSGKRLSDLVVEKQAGTDKILPVTGATITSTAVTEAVRQAVQRIIETTGRLYSNP